MKKKNVIEKRINEWNEKKRDSIVTFGIEVINRTQEKNLTNSVENFVLKIRSTEVWIDDKEEEWRRMKKNEEREMVKHSLQSSTVYLYLVSNLIWLIPSLNL